MSDDRLRNRLAASNPLPPTHPVDPVTSDRARTMMEDAMSTTTRTQAHRTRNLVGAIAALLVLVLGIGAFVATQSPGDDAPPLVLTAEGGTTISSCLPFSVDTLAGMSPAFRGTVTALTDSVATLDVDRWYIGGDAATVEIQYQPGFEALIGTPNLEVGQTYLITAASGVVNGCGYSGLATPDLQTAFDEAFGS